METRLRTEVPILPYLGSVGNSGAKQYSDGFPSMTATPQAPGTEVVRFPTLEVRHNTYCLPLARIR